MKLHLGYHASVRRLVGTLGLIVMTGISSLAWAGDQMHGSIPVVHFLKANGLEWYVINDDVMGGVSRSTIETTDQGTGLFSGTISLENNGGFASIRAAVQENCLAGQQGLEIRVRGDGRSYELRLRLGSRFDGIAYRAAFETRAGEWTTARVLFEEFKSTYRGRFVHDAPSLAAENIQQIGFLLADKNPGEFSLEIDFVRAINNGDEDS